MEKRVSIDLGRSAGAKVGMEFVVYKEGEIIRHPKTGEVLDVEQIQTGRVVLKKVREKLSQGEIVEEEPPGAITYGQLVYSVGAMAEAAPATPPEIAPPPPAGKSRLFVDAVPAAARVRILNIVPRYYSGIELRPGSYHIEVSAPGYRTDTRWVTVGYGENKRTQVTLDKIGSTSATYGVGSRANPSPTIGGEGQSDLPAGVRYYVDSLRSGSSKRIITSSKKIVRSRSFHPAILDAAQSVLLGGYRSKTSNRTYIDAMSWLCNVLGASRSSRFRGTLQTVANGAPNRKLKKYAHKNLKKLK
jgi:hypothetical protein